MSYNQPRLFSLSCWNPFGITDVSKAELGFRPSRIFVDRNNTIYITDEVNQAVHLWHQESDRAKKTSLKTKFGAISLFVNTDGDIFLGSSEGLVEKWTMNAMNSVVVATFSSQCNYLFVDVKNDLYCSLTSKHRVVRSSLDIPTSMPVTVAGNGKDEATSVTLRRPGGIFVDTNFDLYIADCGNNRVQLFKNGQNKGETVAAKLKKFRVLLECPIQVFLDENKNLFIVDRGNHRVIRSNSYGFDCVIGCSGVRGIASHRLYMPTDGTFDSLGNIFIVDRGNERIQKFLLMSNTLGK